MGIRTDRQKCPLCSFEFQAPLDAVSESRFQCPKCGKTLPPEYTHQRRVFRIGIRSLQFVIDQGLHHTLTDEQVFELFDGEHEPLDATNIADRIAHLLNHPQDFSKTSFIDEFTDFFGSSKIDPSTWSPPNR